MVRSTIVQGAERLCSATTEIWLLATCLRIVLETTYAIHNTESAVQVGEASTSLFAVVADHEKH